MEWVLEAVKKGEFLSTVSGAGVVRIWETRRACSRLLGSKEQLQVNAYEKELRARETAELGEEAAGVRAQERRFNRNMGDTYGHGHAPLWRVVSGIFPGMDLDAMHPNERAGRLTQLIRAVEKIVRYEWRAFEGKRKTVGDGQKADGGTQKAENGNGSNSNGNGDEGVIDPRVRWWDPVRLVCEHFGIAYSALSRFSREVAGLAASDLTDRVKAETVKRRMKEDVRQWVLEIYKEEEGNAESELIKAGPDDAADFLWSRVTVKRGRGRWSRASWAARFGYSSYTRFQRACLAAYGISPVELERAVLEEVVRERAEGKKIDDATGAGLERQEGSTNYEGRSTTEEGNGDGRLDDGGVRDR